MDRVRLLYCRTLSVKEPLSFISTPIIRGVDWGPWSHEAIVMPDGVNVTDATFTHGGVKERPLVDVLGVSTQWAMRDFEVPNAAAGYSWLLDQDGKPYDDTGVLGLALHRDWQQDDAWWCSELCEAFLAACGLVRFMTGQGTFGVRRITPQGSWQVAAGVVATSFNS